MEEYEYNDAFLRTNYLYDHSVVSRLQGTVSKYGTQFRGNSQHDALEFLLWLLDRLHEDFNSSSTFPGGNNKSKSSGKVRMFPRTCAPCLRLEKYNQIAASEVMQYYI